MKIKTFLVMLFCIAVASVNAQQSNSIYDYKLTDINGNTFEMSELKGKKVLLVNTATQCGFSSQDTDMEKLYNDYKDKNFVVVAIPSNDFGNKEPGSNEEIKSYVDEHNLKFPVMAKTSVKGDSEDPLYKWLTHKDLNGVMDTEVAWNYQKYMIDEEGKLVGIVEAKESPNSDKVIKWLEEDN
jgi:glutathione peroxidase